VDKIKILYFLEDRAQEGFITALVKRIANELEIASNTLVHDIRSARHGSKAITEFRAFIKDTKKGELIHGDFLVVSIDGNCKGHEDRIKQLKKYIKSNHPFNERVVYAVPDPHIERWYLMDQKALKAGIGLDKAPSSPSYECKRGKSHYKQILRKALKDSNISSLFGGPEYAEKIVDHIENLESLSQQNAGFKAFIDDLKRMFRLYIKRESR
jgi:hypothetical protein